MRDRLIELGDMLGQRNAVEMMLDSSRAEAIKAFAERLKYKTCCIAQCHFNYAEVEFAIDTLVKEMTEDNNESQNT